MRIVDCEERDEQYLYDGLTEYNLSQVPLTQQIPYQPLNKKVVDDDDRIIAGCIARMYCWNVVYVDILWVDEQYRKAGLGRWLLRAVEEEAVRNHCTLIHLDTFDFQAKDFYLKQGFEIFGVLEDCPPGHCRYYLKKKLVE